MSLFLVLLMLVISVSGCNGSDESQSTEMNTSEESEIYTEIAEPRNTLVVGYSDSSLVLNPFCVDSNGNDFVEMTSVRLLTIDRNGKLLKNAALGEKSEFNGQIYEYNGVANVEVNTCENGEIDLVFKLRNGIKCGDGSLVTVDDVIFTMYVLSDPAYNGPCEFSKLPILGMDDYKNNISENIKGIIRVDDDTLALRLTSFDESFIPKLNIYIAPIRYYGDDTKYDYTACSFGFEKGNIEPILTINGANAAGPYCYVSHDEKSIKFKRNFWFYKGIPNIEYVDLKYCEINEILSNISNGYLDVAEIPLDSNQYQEIIEINGAEDGLVFRTSIYETDLATIAFIANASAIDTASYSCEYTKDYPWINDIHSIKINSGF